jgi:hypothetical protein
MGNVPVRPLPLFQSTKLLCSQSKDATDYFINLISDVRVIFVSLKVSAIVCVLFFSCMLIILSNRPIRLTALLCKLDMFCSLDCVSYLLRSLASDTVS